MTIRITLFACLAFPGLVFSANVNWTGGAASWTSTGNPGWNGPLPGPGDVARIQSGEGPITVNSAVVTDALEIENGGGSGVIIDSGTLELTGSNGDGNLTSLRMARNGNATGNSLTMNGGILSLEYRAFVGSTGASDEATFTLNGGTATMRHMNVRQSDVIITGGRLNTLGLDKTGDITLNNRNNTSNTTPSTWTMSGGLVEADAISMDDTSVGTQTAGTIYLRRFLVRESATYTLSGTGAINISADLDIGFDNVAGENAEFIQDGGRVVVGNNINLADGNGGNRNGKYTLNSGDLYVGGTLNVNEGSGSLGTFELNGGTAHLNNISRNDPDANAVFTWNGGTITKANLFDNSITYSVDTDPTQLIMGNGGGATATLDLGPLFLSGSVTQTVFDRNGGPGGADTSNRLDIDTDTELIAVGNTYLLRPFGRGISSDGFLELVKDFDGGINGTFGTFALPTGGYGFTGDLTTITAPADLPLNRVLLAYVDSAGLQSFDPLFNGTVTDVQLWFNVSGILPEPGTISLLFIGLGMIRFARRVRSEMDEA